MLELGNLPSANPDKVGKKFALPLDVASEAVGILATRGAGKSYTSAVIVEELFASGVQVCVLDPTGVYWGLRSSADGKRDGLAIYVLGGEHGDLPLEPSAGALIADVLVDTGQSFVIDLSAFETKAAQTRFATAFAERLYRRKGTQRSTLHLIVDEADEFAPQRHMGVDAARMVGAYEALVRRGRSRGIGVTLITQRSATLNKNVLDLIDTLIAMRMTGPRDRKVVSEWVNQKEARDELGVLESLPGLPTGTAWVWSPVRGILERVVLRRIATFDSYATPKPGQKRPEPERLTPLSLEALGEQIAKTVAKVQENDPKALRRLLRERDLRINALERELSARQEEARTVEIEVEVPVFTDEDREWLAHAAKALDGIPEQMIPIQAKLEELAAKAGAKLPGQTRLVAPPRKPIVAPPRTRPTAPPTELNGDAPLKAGARRMVAMLARMHPEPLTKIQLGTLADITPNSGTFSDYKNGLIRAGLIAESGGVFTLTADGIATAGADLGAPPPTPHELKAMWEVKFKAGARRMLDVLFAAHPDGLTRDELSQQADITRDSGTFSDYLNALKRNNLAVEAGGVVKAGESLFIGR